MTKTLFYLFFLFCTIVANAQCYTDILVTEPSCGLENGRIEIQHIDFRDGFQFNWSGTYPDTNTVENLPAQTYFINIIADGLGGESCDTLITITLTDQSTSIPEISSTVTIMDVSCEESKDGSVDISVSGGMGDLSYTWSNGSTLEDASGLGAGVYSVVVSDSLNCKDTLDNIPLNSPASITIDMEDEMQIYKGGSAKAVIDIEGGNGYLEPLWTPATGLSCTDCLLPVVNPKETTTYTLTITDDNNCQKTGKFTAVVNDDVPEPFIPNAFTPNGDGNNDVFKVYGSTIDWVDLKIFDRWGKVVGTIETTDGFWDGKDTNGEDLPTAAYVYVLEFNYKSELGINSPAPKTGSITLIRE